MMFLRVLLDSSYQHLAKPLFFRIKPETVHDHMVKLGERLGNLVTAKSFLQSQLVVKSDMLRQHITGINFENPIGLSAGFDYEARLTQITPSLGFGFHTVGTITANSSSGNPSPQLGRLPKSKSLMVNKGFKNLGAVATAKRLSGLELSIPLGISIGRTNNRELTQKESVKDILESFTIFENKNIMNAFYELNISCPNLQGNVTFYKKRNLKELLLAIDSLRLKKPIFVKMPISLPDKNILLLLDVISKHSPSGVIIGNLQKNRDDPALHQEEVAKFPAGNFSGKPTFKRSNELISIAYSHFGKRLTIIGCGGVFTSEDAYTKVKKGASLVQLITGMIFEGPQLISEINMGLIDLLRQDGFKNIREAVGTDLRKPST